MKITFVTSNKGKLKEVRGILSEFGIEVENVDMDIPEIKSFSQREIVREKARYAIKFLKKPLVVEDTGIYFKTYRNFPGTFSKFVFQSLGLKGILKLLKNEIRDAYFLSMVAYCEPGKEPLLFEGKCEGIITKKVVGKVDKKLPYDSIFIPKGDKRTFSQMTKEEKARYSHRAKAFRKFAKWWLKYGRE